MEGPYKCALFVCWVALVAAELVRFAAAEETIRCRPFAQSGLVSPTPRTEPQAIDRLKWINEAVQTQRDDVLFLGDSITQRWDPLLWEQHYARRGALNAGIDGDRTENLWWRLANGNLSGPQPKAVVLLIGTNDLGHGRSPEVAAEGIRAILVLLRMRLPDTRIVLLGLLPRSESPTAPLRRRVQEVNRLIRSCDDSKHIFFADIGKDLLDPAGRLTSAISPDRLHFTTEGYRKLAAQLDPLLVTVPGPVDDRSVAGQQGRQR